MSYLRVFHYIFYFKIIHAFYKFQKDRLFEKKMRKKGLTVKRMGEDGACLFRAVADQVYGDQEMHAVVRRHCMDYIVSCVILILSFISIKVVESF